MPALYFVSFKANSESNNSIANQKQSQLYNGGHDVGYFFVHVMANFIINSHRIY